MDQRGRGKSDYDEQAARYNVATYVADTFAVLDHFSLQDVVLIGTSMGGLMAMLMASMMPTRIRGIVLNDVGPVVEPAGIARIQSYVGTGGPVASWADASVVARSNNEIAFPDYDEAEWRTFAKRIFIEENGFLRLAYDPAISQPISDDHSSAVPADLWSVFDNLVDVPVLVIRGNTSDILAAETVAEMARRHPDLRTIEVANRGHAPILDEPEALRAINSFLGQLKAGRTKSGYL
jgi:pimeloyl-ACP methyl ester carboxylesterase